MKKEDDIRIKELKRMIYLRTEIIKQAKKDIKKARDEINLIENKHVTRTRKRG